MSRKSPGTTLVWAVWLAWTVGVGFVAIPYLVVTRAPGRFRGGRVLTAVLGVPLVLGGAALYVWASRTLTAPGGTPVPTHGPRELVTGGPYRYSRNPIYVGAVAVIVGEALVLRHVGLLAYAAVAWGYARVLVGFEERQLRRKYGAPYDEYRASIPRWLGRPRTPPR